MAEDSGKEKVTYYQDVVTQESQILGMQDKDGKLTTDEAFPNIYSILNPLDEIHVHQHLDVVEVCLGWERNNRYSLYNKTHEQVLYTYEGAQCYARQCYGSLREFSLVTTDNDDNRLLKVHRPLRCSSRCFYACCCLQEMSIEVVHDSFSANVRERWSCCIPQYTVEDKHQSTMFTLEGSCCHCRCCCNINFKVINTSGVVVATIVKHWGGCKELIGACNDFSIFYEEELSGSEKSVILAASFLLDFNYFERHGKCF